MDYAAWALSHLSTRLVEEAKRHFHGQDAAHDWQHNMRVIGMCERIGREEGADMTVLRLSALLHDIGRAQERRTGECHAEISARLAADMLRAEGVEEAQIASIQHAILAHRFRKDYPPHSLEAQILYDADKLDSIGAIGVARAFAFSGVIGQPIHSDDPDQHTPYREYQTKLKRISEALFTDEARRIAAERHRVMADFFDQWREELRGVR
ncbi:HD domain-containing protein [Brevibacillus sp. TJ4]|uniref:HD domain-containing protein n=1 Tax=Brevibacillus sp. TJ4 TaxID=3234853 RepID=UPI0037D562A3